MVRPLIHTLVHACFDVGNVVLPTWVTKQPTVPRHPVRRVLSLGVPSGLERVS